MQYGNRSERGRGQNSGTAYAPSRPDGCHPVDGCQDGTPFYGSVFQYLAANVDRREHGQPDPARRTGSKRRRTASRIAFIGETLEGTPLVVTPSGVAGLDFLDEADTVNALVPRLKQRGVETIVLLLHQGGFQNPPPASQGGFTNVERLPELQPGPISSTSSTGSTTRSTSSSARTRTRRTSARSTTGSSRARPRSAG